MKFGGQENTTFQLVYTRANIQILREMHVYINVITSAYTYLTALPHINPVIQFTICLVQVISDV